MFSARKVRKVRLLVFAHCKNGIGRPDPDLLVFIMRRSKAIVHRSSVSSGESDPEQQIIMLRPDARS